MVASSQTAASLAGCEMLDRGGSAADAAVAMAAALAVTEPMSTGLGGDAFVLYYDQECGRLLALNGSGRAPAALGLELLRERGLEEIPQRHGLSVTVPGAFAAWCDLHQRFGRLPVMRVLGPAVQLAEKGFTPGPITAELWARGEELLRSAKHGEQLLLRGSAPRPGDVFTNPNLAGVLRSIGDGGAGAFYTAQKIAGRIAEAVQKAGGVLSAEDMAAHRGEWVDPIYTDFEGLRIYECPPNGQGLAALLGLNILSQAPRSLHGGQGSADRLHLLIEAMRLAFADAKRYIADPAMVGAPVEALLRPGYARERAATLSTKRMKAVYVGDPMASSDTVQFCAVDAQGNACSMVNSVYMNFGSGIVPEGLGFALQNRGANFSTDASHPNCVAPCKRPYHTIIPGMAVRQDGSLYGPFGVMGGFMQPQAHVQVLASLQWDSCSPQEALDQPRFCLDQGDPAGDVLLEEGILPATERNLAGRGHPVKMVKGYGRSVFGRGQIIIRDPETGCLSAGSDPRADGCALGW